MIGCLVVDPRAGRPGRTAAFGRPVGSLMGDLQCALTFEADRADRPRMHRKSKQAISRIAPLQPPYKPDVAEVLQAFGPPLDLFRLFARRPARARGILGWGRYYLSRDLTLTLRDRELVILRTTALLGAQYEWGVHLASYADKAVLDHGQIRSVTPGQLRRPVLVGPARPCRTARR
jgi:hypothetical protein